MENQTPGSGPKSKFRWGRFFLLIVIICLSMAIGYIGGNLLKAKLIKKLDELDEKEKGKSPEVEDIAHEKLENDDDDEKKDFGGGIVNTIPKLTEKAKDIAEKVKDAEEVVETKVKTLLNNGKKKGESHSATVK